MVLRNCPTAYDRLRRRPTTYGLILLVELVLSYYMIKRQYFRSKDKIKHKLQSDSKRKRINRETKRIVREIELRNYSKLISKIDALAAVLAVKVT